MENQPTFTTELQVRRAFWQGTPLRRFWQAGAKRQNQYSATVRSEWVHFVDMLARDGHISEELAARVTL